MSILNLKAGAYQGKVDTVGAGIAGLTYHGSTLLHSYNTDSHAPAYMGKTLLPWPNRITGGKYCYAGTEHQLAINDCAHNAALHGLAAWTNWNIVSHTDNSAVLEIVLPAQPGYPWALQAQARFELSETAGLSYVLVTRNVDKHTAPYGAAAHPYVCLAGEKVDSYIIDLPARKALLVDANLVPQHLTDAENIGHIGKQQIDQAYTELPPGTWDMHIRSTNSDLGVCLTTDARWVQFYTGEEIDRTGLAVEPMTCAPDAFNSGMGLVHLEPGQEHEFSFSICGELRT